MTSLGMRRCRPLISPLVAGTKPVHPLDAGPGVHDEDMASRARAPRGWPPGAGRIGARPRNCGSWWAATRLQRPATRLDVSCHVAAPRRGHVVVCARRYAAAPKPRRGAATRHRYGVPVQSLFMKPSKTYRALRTEFRFRAQREESERTKNAKD